MALSRISTGVLGLDPLIEGGIPKGFNILIAGNPGTGKTVLTSHFLYNGLQTNENGIYVSFSESRLQFLTNTARLGMNFDEYEGAQKFLYLDFTAVTKHGMQEALEEILSAARELNAKRIVIDSLSTIFQSFGDINEARIALHVVLGKIFRTEDITSMMISEVSIGSSSIGSGIEEFVVDGIIKLEYGTSNTIPIILKVMKMRGTSINREPHICNISDNGMIIYEKQPLTFLYPIPSSRISTGIKGLDEKIGKGLLRGTVTALLGPSGIGKTTMGLEFILDGAERNNETGILYSLEESVEEIRSNAYKFGYNIKESENNGKVFLRNILPEEINLDALILLIKQDIDKIKPSRIVFDSISALETIYPEDIYYLVKRLINLCQVHEITAIFTFLTTLLTDYDISNRKISSIVQNIILLKFEELDRKIRRSLLILKMRSTQHDNSILQFEIVPEKGIEVS
ncbi:MAG TPA: ATPase domain-containing protein [Candidatus Nitrosocosmicus sp.]|nr:ATPase domain-containing protein [Candidatus Nitrosocosmicus sp.]